MKGITILACILLAAVAVAASNTHVVKGTIERLPFGWTQLDRASPNDSLDLTILIRQTGLAELEAKFWSVSNPQSEEYGQYLSHDEVNQLVQPQEQHIAGVMQWLHSHQIRTTSETLTFTPNRDMIRVRTTVGKAEALLHAKYFTFSHEASSTQLVRTLSYKIPTYLSEAIDTIGPTIRFPTPSTLKAAKVSTKKYATNKKNLKRRLAPNDACTSGTTPLCLKQLYSVNDYVASNAKSSVAVTGYLEQYISTSDLSLFFSTFDPSDARNVTIIGPNDQTNPGIEASLDIQYVMSVAPGVPATFWYTVGANNEPFLDFMLALASDSNPPFVISTSYGEDEAGVDYDHGQRLNVEFQKAGVRGLSILFSSGDGGVSGGQSQQCTTFNPTFPAGSPYVTAVGGTTQFGPEIAASFSSGGFSNYWSGSIAPYQTSAVQTFLSTSTALPTAGLYNATGRGFPDVSAQGTNFPIFQGGSTQEVEGTSCSAPTFAAIVSLLNDIRFNAGKSPLGFLNPLFYQNPSMFTDVTSGSNPGCGTNGFTATKGWDPVTGLGTPKFEAMANVVKNMP